MYSEVTALLCVILALQVSPGYCSPSGERENIHLADTNVKEAPPEVAENDDDEGYQVILMSPTQTLKVEVVDSEGNTAIRHIEIPSSEETSDGEEQGAQTTTEAVKKSRKLRGERRDVEKEIKCNWRRLTKLYINKRAGINFSKGKRKEIMDAFKVLCDNPEKAIARFLKID